MKKSRLVVDAVEQVFRHEAPVKRGQRYAGTLPNGKVVLENVSAPENVADPTGPVPIPSDGLNLSRNES